MVPNHVTVHDMYCVPGSMLGSSGGTIDRQTPSEFSKRQLEVLLSIRRGKGAETRETKRRQNSSLAEWFTLKPEEGAGASWYWME